MENIPEKLCLNCKNLGYGKFDKPEGDQIRMVCQRNSNGSTNDNNYWALLCDNRPCDHHEYASKILRKLKIQKISENNELV